MRPLSRRRGAKRALVALGVLFAALAGCGSEEKPAATSTPGASRTVPATATVQASPTLPPTATPSATPGPPPDLGARPGAVWNFALVGHEPVGFAGSLGGLALKGDCAYVGSYAPAFHIVDISDPSRPALVRSVQMPAGSRPVELRTVPDLNLLVVAGLGAKRLLTYDVSNCQQPTPLGALDLAVQPHEFFLWRNGPKVLAYIAAFDTGPPSLLVVDLSDPAAPVEAARWTAAEDGAQGILHSLSVSADGGIAYLALWNGGFLVASVDLPQIAIERAADGSFAPALLPNVHSAVPMRDPRFVLLASEVFRCPFAGIAVADVSDPSHPKVASRFTLPENRCTDLPSPDAYFTPHNPLIAGSMAFVSWYAAGVQAVDLSDPAAPKRAGQFVPTGEGAPGVGPLGSYPVQMFSYPILRDGLLYVVDSQTGLYVLRYTGPGADALQTLGLAEGNIVDRR